MSSGSRPIAFVLKFSSGSESEFEFGLALELPDGRFTVRMVDVPFGSQFRQVVVAVGRAQASWDYVDMGISVSV